jgi:hypothetical protein
MEAIELDVFGYLSKVAKNWRIKSHDLLSYSPAILHHLNFVPCDLPITASFNLDNLPLLYQDFKAHSKQL